MSNPKVRPCTWADAEKVFPGVEAEWRSMCGEKGAYFPPSNIEVRLELRERREGQIVLHVIQIDHENKWFSPPEWRCWELGKWTHPMPMPNTYFLTFGLTF